MSWLQKYLSDLATVISGVPFRSRIENQHDGQIAVIQARDLSETGEVRIATSARVKSLPGSSEASLRSGDVLFQPRGARFSVGILVDQPMPVAAAAPLLTLRCDLTQIDPEFLVLFLQLPRTQAVLKNAAVGTHIPQVPRWELTNLPVDLPDLVNQKKLVELNRLTRREVELTARLIAKRERLLELAVRDLSNPVARTHGRRANDPLPNQQETNHGRKN
jgi:restriction endonuclease S subunit